MGLIGFIAWLMPRDKRGSQQLFIIGFLRKFGSIYQTFYYKRCYFLTLSLLRKLIFGAIVGTLPPSTISNDTKVFLVGYKVVQTYSSHHYFGFLLGSCILDEAIR